MKLAVFGLSVVVFAAGTAVACDASEVQPPIRIGGDHEFVHPGILHDRAELDFIRQRVQRGDEPWALAWKQLRDHPVAHLDWEPRPREEVVRGAYNNPNLGANELMEDGQAAFAHALQWYMTRDEAHAEKSIEILNAWATQLKAVGGHDARLLVGMAGVNHMGAAELMRHTHEGWAKEEQERFERMLYDVFYETIKDFYPTANGNWDAAMIQTMMAMGVFLDDHRMFNRGVDYFMRGRGNGAITHYVNRKGITQESGRSQGYAQMGLAYLGIAAEIGWTQGLDLYGAFDDRLLKGYEITAKYNLGYEVDYTPFTSIEQRYHYDEISESGRGNLRPMYETAYNHYVNRRGREVKYLDRAVEKTRPEGYSRSHTSWRTLLFAGLPAFEKGRQ